MERTPLDSLDVPAMLEISEPRGAVPWAWYAVGTGILLAVVNQLLSDEARSLRVAIGALSSVAIMGILLAVLAVSFAGVRALRRSSRSWTGLRS